MERSRGTYGFCASPYISESAANSCQSQQAGSRAGHGMEESLKANQDPPAPLLSAAHSEALQVLMGATSLLPLISWQIFPLWTTLPPESNMNSGKQNATCFCLSFNPPAAASQLALLVPSISFFF